MSLGFLSVLQVSPNTQNTQLTRIAKKAIYILFTFNHFEYETYLVSNMIQV